MLEPAGQQDAPAEPLSREQVHALAELARLDLSPEQLELYRHQLGGILGYVQRLKALSLDQVEPLVSPLESSGELAADDPRSPSSHAPLTPAQLIAMAPESFEHYVRVPKVIGGGGGSAAGGGA